VARGSGPGNLGEYPKVPSCPSTDRVETGRRCGPGTAPRQRMCSAWRTMDRRASGEPGHRNALQRARRRV